MDSAARWSRKFTARVKKRNKRKKKRSPQHRTRIIFDVAALDIDNAHTSLLLLFINMCIEPRARNSPHFSRFNTQLVYVLLLYEYIYV